MSKATVEPLRLGRKKKEHPKPKPMPYATSVLWELMEMEAPLKFFVDGKEQPAFLLFPKYHYLSVKKSYHSLYVNGVGLIAAFPTRQKALERLKQIVETANFPLRLYQVNKYGHKRGKRILFAENTVQRVDMTDAKWITFTHLSLSLVTEHQHVTGDDYSAQFSERADL